jgi:MFS transporter, DHA1 family, 2-module integral membrane pump EmrD
VLHSIKQRILAVETRGARATLCFLIILLVAQGIFMTDLYTPSLPTISHYFHTNMSLVKMSISIYLLGLTFPQLFFGPLSDAIGRRKVIFPGLLIALLGSFICMRSNSIEMLNCGRFLQGLGIGALTSSARAIMRDVFNQEQLIRVVAIMGFSIALAPAIAPLIGALLAHHFGWRSVFVAMTLIISLSTVCVYALLPESNRRINPQSFRLPLILGNYKKLLTMSTFVSNMILSGCAFSVIMVYFTISPYLFEHHLHTSVTHYAQISCGLVLCMMISRFINIQCLKHYTVPSLIRFGFCIILSGALLLLFTNLLFTENLWTVLLPTAIILSGISFVFGNVMTQALAECHEIAGTAGALYSSIQVLTASLMSFIASKIPSDSAIPMSCLFIGIAFSALILIHSNQREK